jgi:outer membrane protein TolC
MKSKIIIAALAGGLFVTAAFAQDAATTVDLSDGLTLEEAGILALTESPHIKLASSGEEIADARLRQARATWLPQVSVSETWMKSDNPVWVFGTLLEQGVFTEEYFDPDFLNDPGTFENWRTEISAQVPVFDQLRRWSTISQAQLGVEQASLQSEMARQLLRYHTLRAYYGVLVARARKDVADESVRLAEADVTMIRDRFETGLLVESDLLAAEVQLADFRQQQIDADGNLVIARKALSSVIGLPLTAEYEITGELTPTTFVAQPRGTLLTEGLEARPDVQIALLSSNQASLGKRIATGQYLPRVDAFANWAASGDSISDQNDNYSVGAVVSWNVIQPGRMSRVSEARALELAAVASLEKVRNEAELDVESAYHRFLAAGQRVAVGEKSAAQANETLRIVRDRYDEGLTTITEVLRAQTAAVQAKLARLGSLYDYYLGYADVLRATGALTTIEPFVSPTRGTE